MARHLSPSNKKKITIPSFRLPKFPKMEQIWNRRVPRKHYDRVFTVKDMLLLLAATLFFILGILLPIPFWAETALLALASFAALAPILVQQLQKVLRRKLPDEDCLTVLGVIAAFVIGESVGGAIAAILYRLGQILEAYALAGGENTLDLLRDQLPEKVTVETAEGPRSAMPENVEIGDVIQVAPGELIPVDGVILSGTSEVDCSALTGSKRGVSVGRGEQVFSGCLNCTAPLRIQVTHRFSDSAAACLLREIEGSSRYETLPERLAWRIAAFLGPVIGILALLFALIPPLFTGAWLVWLRRGAILLLLASPSAMVISVPLACLGAELSGAGKGILSRGHDCFEVLAQVKTMVFGKTGTITEGRYTITELFPKGVSGEDLLVVAGAAESFSQHPIALALKHASGWTPEVAESVMEVEELPGRGISAFIEGRHVYVGNAALLQEHGIPFDVPVRSGSAIHVAVENRYWGHIMVSDKPREGAFDALEAVRIQGVDQMVMLTGDVLSVSRPLASSLGFDMMRPELTPEGKLSAIDYLLSGKGAHASLAFVGDGIHDAAMLERADVGISLDALPSLSSSDAADILLLDNEIALLPKALHIARTLRRILWENLGILLGTKVLLLILALCGVMSISIAAVCSTVSVALAILNAMRAFSLD